MRNYGVPHRAVGALAVLAIVAAIAIGACAAGPSGGPAPSPSNQIVTITVTSAGASPTRIVVTPGSRVMFVNEDSREHQMYSDPHPEHTDCPEFDQVGSLGPGQRRTTGNLNTPRTCGFHDHIYFDNASLKGTVTIQ